MVKEVLQGNKQYAVSSEQQRIEEKGKQKGKYEENLEPASKEKEIIN